MTTPPLCYNPSDKDKHRELGYDCDGVYHRSAPTVELRSSKPWYNDGDKVGGIMATVTLILLGVVIGALATKLVLWLLTGSWTF